MKRVIDKPFLYNHKSLLILLFISLIYFLENFDRYLIAVSPVPYIDYSSYEYSILSGPAFTIVYSLSGLLFALYYKDTYVFQSKHNVSNSIVFTKFNILMIATVMFSISFGLTAYAIYFYQLVLIRIIMGISQSIVTPFSISIISDNFSVINRGTAFGIFNSGTYFAFSLSLSLGTYLYNSYAWKFGYLLFGIVGIGLACILPLVSCYESYLLRYHHHNSNINDLNSNKLLDNNSNRSIENMHSSTITTTNVIKSITYKQQQEERHSLSLSTNHVYSLLHSEPPPSSSSSLPVLEQFVSNNSNNNNFFLESNIANKDINNNNNVQIDNNILDNNGTIDSFYNRLCNMKIILYEICFIYWYQQPGIYMLCLATGVRLGAGYIWASYTSVYFSDLFVKDIDTSCMYSYNANASNNNDDGSICSSDFPYCVSGECNQLTDYPWHNKGLDSLYLEEYMSWVPIVGSAFGSFLGGMISDYLIHTKHTTTTTSVSSNNYTTGSSPKKHMIDICNGNPAVSDKDTSVNLLDHEESSSSLSNIHHHKQHFDNNLNKNNEEEEIEESLKSNNNNNRTHEDQSLRMLIASISNIIALPLVLYSLELKFPYCFLILIASGMVGELYLSQSLALLSDSKIIPVSLIIPSTAFFMFIITLIGGNVPILVPFLISIVGFKHDADISFQAESIATGDNSEAQTVHFIVQNQNSKQLQYSLMFILGGCYGLASMFYLISYIQMKRNN